MSEESEALVFCFFSPKCEAFGGDVSAFGGTEGAAFAFCLGINES
jgi:hypothetical protein